jgi:hypothetical protein
VAWIHIVAAEALGCIAQAPEQALWLALVAVAAKGRLLPEQALWLRRT